MSTPTFNDVSAAYFRIGDWVRKTPCVASKFFSEASGSQVFLKLENLQMSGSYKERGALNALLSLSPEQKKNGVIAASAGNHAQGVAFHAKRLGISAKIVMPEQTPLIKVKRTQDFGADVVLFGEGFDEAYQKAQELAALEARHFVHPFNDPAVIAGQGTIALELWDAVRDLDVILVPVGGGGLLSGIALAYQALNPKVQVIGVEAEKMAPLKVSLESGVNQEVPRQRTMADGIAVRKAVDIAFTIAMQNQTKIETVSEFDIAKAILALIEAEKTVTEGAGAASVAALLKGISGLEGKKVCCILSGGNIDVNVISRIIERGLVREGRLMRIRVDMPDYYGNLARVTQLIASNQANIVKVDHDGMFASVPIGMTAVEFTIETYNREHAERVLKAIETQGFPVKQRCA